MREEGGGRWWRRDLHKGDEGELIKLDNPRDMRCNLAAYGIGVIIENEARCASWVTTRFTTI